VHSLFFYRSLFFHSSYFLFVIVFICKQNLGSKKRTLEGFSSATAINHFGYIYDADIVKRTPAAWKTKMCRLVGGKVTLAARVDSFRQYPNGNTSLVLFLSFSQISSHHKMKTNATIRTLHFECVGEKGQQFRAEIEKKLEKWLEPLPPKKEKPLPAPDERSRKRRGGRKYIVLFFLICFFLSNNCLLSSFDSQ
jgi:U4/U6 small nuclear ribonucleoprotein PRP31